MYELMSIWSGSSAMLTSKRDCTLASSVASCVAQVLVARTRGLAALLRLGEVVVDHDVHALSVNAAAEKVRRDKDALLEVLEVLVFLDAAQREAVKARTRGQVLAAHRSSWFMP